MVPAPVVAAKVESKPASGPFDPHDNDAANGLFMLRPRSAAPRSRTPSYTNGAAAAGPCATLPRRSLPHSLPIPRRS